MSQQLILADLYNLAAILKFSFITQIIVPSVEYKIGDIYYGIAYKIFPSINAAFVYLDIKNNTYKSGFIHINDLSYLKNSKFLNTLIYPNIYTIITYQQKILVQIIKEPNFNKGPRLTTNLVLKGRYLKLLPFTKSIYISRTISTYEHRSLLNAFGKLLQPSGIGIIFLELSTTVNENILIDELYVLLKQWNYILKRSINLSPFNLIYRDDNLLSRIIRDHDANSFKIIYTDTLLNLKRMKFFLKYWQCLIDCNPRKIYFYENTDKLIDRTGIYKAWSQLKNNKVELLTGGYIILETFNAMTIIDVNSGAFNNSLKVKDSILQINLMAAKEIVYQLIIRNIAGIILIDFIDMNSPKDKLLLLEYLYSLLIHDNAKPQIVQFSELGLVEITRKRISLNLNFYLIKDTFIYNISCYFFTKDFSVA
uniref:ribonuclease E n=1 Tax=Porphyridium aerugineum TaxID=2792 RepID=UPI001FCCE7AF|nr:ribonuclease E [Porphyridium aerugineum]UNJ17831.1 ribonuclease E [Porphyridium aerugineum]